MGPLRFDFVMRYINFESKMIIMDTLKSIWKPTLIAWTLGIITFVFVIWIGAQLIQSDLNKAIASVVRGLLLSALFTSIVIYWTRKEANWRELIGWKGISSSLSNFILGVSIILIPLILTILISSLAGWAAYDLNPDGTIVKQQLLGLLIVFLFEAFPEELMFRGYIQGKLNSQYIKWKAGLAVVVLFVLFPIVVVPIQEHLLNLPIQIGSNSSITGGYLMYMTLFAAMMVYLRNLTGSVWTTMGFHLVFVSMNNFLGLESTSLVVITDYTSEGPIQITLIACILIILGGLILLSKRKNTRAKLALMSN
jgi:uncharacterized protein